jgi:UDPglucose--hexose-1-phosphate uridylyltransferase
VIVAPERSARPNDFPVERRRAVGGFCAFCAGHEDRTPPETYALREAGSAPNGPGWRVRVVPNRFPALSHEDGLHLSGDALARRMDGFGVHDVIIETPRHALSMSELTPEEVREVFLTYRARLADLATDERLAYAMIFKNVGAPAGASLEHCHSQLVALPAVPVTIREELHGARRYRQAEGRCVYCAVVERERRLKERLVHEGEAFAVVCPYASRFPFETWVLPRAHVSDFRRQPEASLAELGEILGELLRRLDVALDCPAYNYIMNTAPFRADAGTPPAEVMAESYHWHLEVIPRVTRVAGFEWGTGFYINPVAPEVAAASLAWDGRRSEEANHDEDTGR